MAHKLTESGTLGQWIRTAREACRMTQGEFAQRLGTTERTVQRWERGGSGIKNERLVSLSGLLQEKINHEVAKPNMGKIPVSALPEILRRKWALHQENQRKLDEMGAINSPSQRQCGRYLQEALESQLFFLMMLYEMEDSLKQAEGSGI